MRTTPGAVRHDATSAIGVTAGERQKEAESSVRTTRDAVLHDATSTNRRYGRRTGQVIKETQLRGSGCRRVDKRRQRTFVPSNGASDVSTTKSGSAQHLTATQNGGNLQRDESLKARLLRRVWQSISNRLRRRFDAELHPSIVTAWRAATRVGCNTAGARSKRSSTSVGPATAKNAATTATSGRAACVADDDSGKVSYCVRQSAA